MKFRQRDEKTVKPGRNGKPGYEGDPPPCLPFFRTQNACDDAADPGDAAIREYQKRRGDTDQKTTGKGLPGREIDPVDCHVRSPQK